MVKVNIRRYEAPVTHRVLVELESSFCGSADIQNPNERPNGYIESHEVSETFDLKFQDGWDAQSQNTNR